MDVVFENLDREIPQDETAFPNKVADELMKIEPVAFGFFLRIFSDAFHNMRETKGTSDWICDASIFLTDEVGKQNKMKKEKLINLLKIFKKLNFISSFIEDGALIPVKFNVEFMFKETHFAEKKEEKCLG